MMSAGFGISGFAIVVRCSVAAKLQLLKFSAVIVPLKDDGLGPIMPEGRCRYHVLVNENWAVHLAVIVSEIQGRPLIIGFVYGESTRIRMMPAEVAAGSGRERLRKMGADAAIIDNWRKNACHKSAGEARLVLNLD